MGVADVLVVEAVGRAPAPACPQGAALPRHSGGPVDDLLHRLRTTHFLFWRVRYQLACRWVLPPCFLPCRHPLEPRSHPFFLLSYSVVAQLLLQRFPIP